jgi:hypothetical protein
MTITSDHPLTGSSNAAAAVSAPLVRRAATPCRRPTPPAAPVRFEAAVTQRDTAAAFDQPERRFSVYYLGRPAQTWIDAMSRRPGSDQRRP